MNWAAAHQKLQEDATQNETDAATVITVILTPVITELTSILFALQRHISTPSYTGEPQNMADMKRGINKK